MYYYFYYYMYYYYYYFLQVLAIITSSYISQHPYILKTCGFLAFIW